jgi:hypothetical protein
MAIGNHSLKTLETLRQMGAPLTGWELPPVEWHTVKRMIEVKKACPTCRGGGRKWTEPVDGIGHPVAAPCATCPPRQGWAGYGTGTVLAFELKDVREGRIVWPRGTRFDSRFTHTNQLSCDLCAKRIFNPFNMCPLLATDTHGTPHGIWVGDECARKLGATHTVTFERAEQVATFDRATARLVATLPKEPKPIKPVKPTITGTATDRELTAIARVAVGEALHCVSHHASAAQASTMICLKGAARNPRWDLTVTTRHGASLKHYDLATLKTVTDWKDPGLTDLSVAFGRAIAHLGTLTPAALEAIA